MRARFAAVLTLMACRASAPDAPLEAPPAQPESGAANVADLCADPGGAWDVLAEGQAVARTRGRCLGKEARGYHFVSQVLATGAAQPDYEFHLWLGKDGSPRQGRLVTPLASVQYIWLERGLSVIEYGDRRSIEHREGAAPGELWVLPDHALYFRELMLRLGVGFDGDDRVRQVAYAPGSDRVMGWDMALAWAEAPSGFTGTLASEFAQFALATGTARADLRIESVTAHDTPVYARVDEREPWDPSLPESPRPQYVAPGDLAITAATIPGPGGEPTLAGELVRRADLPPGRHPAVVFLSGSGPQDRYGFVPGSSIDIGSHEIHDALARAGFVVLRYDDRGVGQSERGPTSAPGYRAFVDDARRASVWLGSRPEVDPKRLFVVGHSEGAMTATILGRERLPLAGGKRRPAGLVLLASTGRPLREVIYSQIRHAMADKPQAQVDAAIAEARQIHDAIEADGDVPAAVEPARNWMAEVFREDPLANLRRVRAPVLLMQGSKDFQVDPALDFRPQEALLTSGKAGGKGSEAHLVEGVDHLFKPEPGLSTAGHYADLGRRVDPRVIANIVDWCRARAGLAGG